MLVYLSSECLVIYINEAVSQEDGDRFSFRMPK